MCIRDSTCSGERSRRNRLLLPQDAAAQEEIFLDAPYIHQNNEPKYHALLLRAQEYAKRHRLHCLWFQAVDRFCAAAEVPKDPQKAEAKRMRMLQFHDQKTAGMPGLCPLYKGLNLRVTEKIVRNSTIKILKHTSCTVVDWRLHELDRKQTSASQNVEARFLDYLPEVIVVKFEDVDWQLRGFGVGELPIFPEEHECVLNKETQSKVLRRGFRLLPDFASTAFMVQGASLRAALADCGDVDAAGSVRAMVNAYVILSRVKRAHGLALLRAFSPELFATGVAPGPHCLLKFLHASDNTDTNATYDTSAAQDEFKYRGGKVAARAKFVEQHGMPLKCHGCKNRLGPDSYGRGRNAEVADDDDYESFLLQGCWTEESLRKAWEQGCRRRCRECLKLQSTPAAEKTKECEQCQQMFPEEIQSTICLGCAQWRQQVEHWCEKCGKNKSWDEVHFCITRTLARTPFRSEALAVSFANLVRLK